MNDDRVFVVCCVDAFCWLKRDGLPVYASWVLFASALVVSATTERKIFFFSLLDVGRQGLHHISLCGFELVPRGRLRVVLFGCCFA